MLISRQIVQCLEFCDLRRQLFFKNLLSRVKNQNLGKVLIVKNFCNALSSHRKSLSNRGFSRIVEGSERVLRCTSSADLAAFTFRFLTRNVVSVQKTTKAKIFSKQNVFWKFFTYISRKQATKCKGRWDSGVFRKFFCRYH